MYEFVAAEARRRYGIDSSACRGAVRLKRNADSWPSTEVQAQVLALQPVSSVVDAGHCRALVWPAGTDPSERAFPSPPRFQGPMSTYRCYLLDELDRIKSFIELRALSDTGATSKAQRYAQWARSPFELWRGRDMICRSLSRGEVSHSAERYRGYATELRALAQDCDSDATRLMFEQLAVSYEGIASSLDALQDTPS